MTYNIIVNRKNVTLYCWDIFLGSTQTKNKLVINLRLRKQCPPYRAGPTVPEEEQQTPPKRGVLNILSSEKFRVEQKKNYDKTATFIYSM